MPLKGYNGFQQPGSGANDFNAQHLLVWSILAGISTSTLVRVEAVTNDGGLAQTGFVDIRPLVSQVDGIGNSVPHDVIYRCPYLRVQGGSSGIILDPVVGDVGVAIFADRDISSATANLAPSTPGSGRLFSKADGLYLFSIRGGTLEQYVQFSAAGIKLHSPTAIVLDAPSIELDAQTVQITATTSATVTAPTFRVNGATVLNGPVSQVPGTQGGGASAFDGPVHVTNDVTAAGKSVSTHTHGGVQPGAGSSLGPN